MNAGKHMTPTKTVDFSELYNDMVTDESSMA